MIPLRRTLTGLAATWAVLGATLLALTATISAQLRRLEERGREDERDAGYSTEFMVITALLIAAAVAVLAIITKKLTDKANGLNL